MPVWAFAVFVLFSWGVLLFQDYRHRKERNELLNRLMAKDWAQYQAMAQPTTAKKGSTNYMKDKIERAYNLQYMGEGD